MLQKIYQWFDTFSFQDFTSIFMLLAAVVGGIFALRQWVKRNIYKRGEIVQQLIKILRDDKEIATTMDVIDWSEGFFYNGKICLSRPVNRKCLETLEDDDFFKMIDRTLSHFSYICYLYHQKTLGNKDMKVFDYEIRRLIDNRHIRNYLFSLHHWSKSLNVKTSFWFLIKYSLKKKYLSKDFNDMDSENYQLFLNVMPERKRISFWRRIFRCQKKRQI